MSIAAIVVLGLFAGSLTIEGTVLVPFWRTLAPEQFFALHRQFGPRLFRYFAPLTATAVALPLVSAVTHRHSDTAGWSWTAALLALLVLSAFPLYFDRANKSFASRSLSDTELPGALRRWAWVHWARTLASILAFVASAAAG
jgi:hypothetical protein